MKKPDLETTDITLYAGAMYAAYRLMFGHNPPSNNTCTPFMYTSAKANLKSSRSYTMTTTKKKKKRNWYNPGRYLVFLGTNYKILMSK